MMKETVRVAGARTPTMREQPTTVRITAVPSTTTRTTPPPARTLHTITAPATLTTPQPARTLRTITAAATRDITAADIINSQQENTAQNTPKTLREILQKEQTHEKGRRSDRSTDERNIRSLHHGTKEGRIVVENEHPDLSGGKRRLVDEIHSGHTAVSTVTEEKGKE
ncbi:MAG: hypothetical protein LBH90_02860 [Tannerella sp.]|jgi:hypothetical protein|nr:hypothetical protein [Tannerella sp.]